MFASSVCDRVYGSFKGLGVVLIFFIVTTDAKCFANENYDFSPLNRSSWQVIERANDTVTTYQLNVCGPITGGCSQSSICRTRGSLSVNVGFYTSTPRLTKSNNESGFWLHYSGDKCTDFKNYTVEINFYCSNTLGSPEILHSSKCEIYFSWKSSVACSKKSLRKEVPCYVYDSDNKKHDLSFLIRKKGAYQVKSSISAIEFYINVCSSIASDANIPNCNNEDGACRKVGSELIGFGQPSAPLSIDSDGNLQLIYTTSNFPRVHPGGCSSSPKTIITFVCPHRNRLRISNKYSQFLGPTLAQISNCQYEVEWITEHACPKEQLISSTCQLNEKEHGITVDLKILQKKVYKKYFTTSGQVDGEEQIFYMNLCEQISSEISCHGTSDKTAACMVSPSHSAGLILGSTTNQKLRFSDGQLTLTYENGDNCPHEINSKLETIINFKCSSGERGYPTLNQRIDCSYIFDWETKLACFGSTIGLECKAVNGSRVADLSSLTKHEGLHAWDVFTAGVPSYSSAQIILNVCSALLTEKLFSGCPSDSAICMKDIDGNLLSLGRFHSKPEFIDGKTVFLKYNDGSNCKGSKSKKLSSIITFKCVPGELDSGPSLVRVSQDHCTFELEWNTALACIQATHVGKNCAVYNNELELDFNLTPLKKSPGFYHTNNKEYDFYLNVCGKSTDPACDKIGNHAVCQVKKSDRSLVWNLGSPNDKLYYFNGFVNLTYTGGTPYNGPLKHLRQTSISFLCNLEAGDGHPEFMEESEEKYNFKWYTSLVCPEKPIECSAVDQKMNQYDLSSLTRTLGQNNWEVAFNLNGRNKKFYLNVCRPLIGNIPGCGSRTSACLKDEKSSDSINLGNSIQEPKFVGDILTLEYEMGDICNKEENSTFKVYIHFLCAENTSIENIKFLKLIDQCEYMFIWESKAACPLNDVETSNNCLIVDPVSQTTYNLHSLKSSYTVTTALQDFYIGFCGTSVSCDQKMSKNVAVCSKIKGVQKSHKVLAMINFAQLSLPEHNRILVIYRGLVDENTGKPSSVVEISLICKHGEQGDMKFLRQDGRHYLFEMDTEVACAPETVECSVSDKEGHVYDLSALARTDSNWELVDARASHHDLRYFINICRPLVSVDWTGCRGGDIAACQKVSSSNESFSLGLIHNQPQISENGEITVRYEGGSPCHGGQFKRSTRIEFHCSSVQNAPVFVDETPECEYIVNWDTPAACPTKLSIGENCQVQDPQFGHLFDFTKLKNLSPFTVNGSDCTYKISVCSKVNCGSDQSVGICQIKGSRQVSAGKFNEDLSYDDGEITLTYRDGEKLCHNQYKHSSKITFVCNSRASGGPVFLRESFDCTHLFLWETPLACTPSAVVDCTVRDASGNLYDLTPLSLDKDNHEYMHPEGKFKIFLNVCHSVQRITASLCEYSSGVCAVNITESNPSKRFINLGNVLKGPYFDSNILKLKYEFGGKCEANKQFQTIITFHCDASKLESEPVLLKIEKCEWHFVWETAAACSLQEDESLKRDCTAINPITGFQFDLSKLKKKASGYIFSDSANHHKFMINVCDNVIGSPCGSSTGSCQWTEKRVMNWNAGIANSNLHFRHGVLFLNYSGGAPCHEGQFYRSTFIQFVCSPSAGDGQPVFIDESEDCTYYVTWHTNLACEKQVHCKVNAENDVIDLSPLTKSKGHYTAFSGLDDFNIYEINVCRPLNPLPHMMCPAEAAACKTGLIGEKSQSLGQVTNPPYIDENGHVTIEYTQGSPCPSNASASILSRIIFMCREGDEQGFPELIQITNDCEYVFEWFTNIVCKKKAIHLSYTGPDSCMFINSSTRTAFDMSPLKSFSKQKGDGVNDATFYFCNNKDTMACDKGAAICWKSKSLGSFSTVTATFEDFALKLGFSNGSPCQGSEQWSSEVWFVCDLNEKIGRPELVEEMSCHLYIRWKTSLVCTTLAEECTVFDQHNHLFDFRLLSSHTSGWNFSDLNGNQYMLNLCHGLPFISTVQHEHCHPDDAVCMRSANGKIYSIGRLATQRIKIDDKTGIITFSYNGTKSPNKCGKGRTSQTSVLFSCADGLGFPKFLKLDGCHFIFEWKTVAACVQKRNQNSLIFASGQIQDETSDYYINTSVFENKLYTVEEKRGENQIQYEIVLDPLSQLLSSCKMSGICQKLTNLHQRMVGELTNLHIYRIDNGFEMLMPSNSPCEWNQKKNASAIITFQCSSYEGQPQFIYESLDCAFIFNWQTKFSCFFNHFQEQNHIHKKATSSQDSMSTGVIFAIIGVILGLSLLAIITFNRQNCRENLSYKIRQLWRSTRRGTAYHYTAIPHFDGVNNERTSLLMSQDNSYRIQTLQDESDDEVLQL